MKNETGLVTKIPSWLYENYGISCIDCKMIVPGINLILSILTDERKTYFIKIFHSERSLSSVENEGNISNRLIIYSISAAEVLKNVKGTLASSISVSGHQRAVLVFENAQGRECTLCDEDLSLCADTLFKLHNLAPLDLNPPVFDADREYNKMCGVSDLFFSCTELKDHYREMIRVMKIQDFHSGFSICHGDPWRRNIFISNNNAAFIDFECCCVSSPCLDLGIMTWNLLARSTDNPGMSAKTSFFLDTYNSYSKQKFEFNELAPYMLVHEIWSIWFLLKYHLLTPQITLSAMRDSSAMFSMLKPYLKLYNEY